MNYIVAVNILNSPSRKRFRQGDAITAAEFGDNARFLELLERGDISAAVEDGGAPAKAKRAPTKKAEAKTQEKPKRAPAKAKETVEARPGFLESLRVGIFPGDLNAAEVEVVKSENVEVDVEALSAVKFDDLVDRLRAWGGDVAADVTEKKDVAEAVKEKVEAWVEGVRGG